MLATTLPGVVVRTVTVARPEAFVVKPTLLTGVAPARLSVPLAPVVKPKTLGLLQGKVGIAADFDAPLPADFLLSRNTV